MVALLSSKELTLKPIEETQLTRVGENQLPAAIRQTVSKTIAHTYKYVEESPVLIVKATKPERKHLRSKWTRLARQCPAIERLANPRFRRYRRLAFGR